ncbi:MAG: 1-acyl-sn-glycerol-3-phosphate acyltransferase [Chloroflexota bacterium]|nr:1-acyl-sn-glycerol-3-phosphate acyltransferase [Chloroflexota bacterium]
MSEPKAEVSLLRRTLTDEVFRVAGFSRRGLIRRLFGPILWPPANRVARIIAEFDREVVSLGYRIATKNLLNRFVDEIHVLGNENIPKEGPLVVASNHPGTYDGLAIISSIPRDDMKVVVEGFPFFRSLPGSSPYLIHTPKDTSGRMGVLRSMIRHLEEGGGLLVFPSGKLDPDPEVLPGAMDALEEWSQSLGMILKKVPQTQVLVTIVSGVLAQSCVDNPFARIFDEVWMKLRAAEFIQIVQQMLINRKFDLMPKVRFGDPISVDDLLNRFEVSGLTLEIIERARALMESHLDENLSLPGGVAIK